MSHQTRMIDGLTYGIETVGGEVGVTCEGLTTWFSTMDEALHSLDTIAKLNKQFRIKEVKG